MHPPKSAPLLGPINDSDLPDVATFLGTNFPPDTPPDEWAAAWQQTVNTDGSNAPNHGFMLRAGNEVVGAYPAIYSTRTINGRTEQFCNLAVWFTSPRYRHHSIRMLKAIIAQDGWHFTDLTPIEAVQKLNLRLGFKYLDTTTRLVPNLPWPWLPNQVKVSSNPTLIDSSLTGEARTFYRDHARCKWARHLVLVKDDQSCYVQWRRERHKNLPIFSSIRYVSNPAFLRQAYPVVGRHLLVRFGAVGTLVEDRVIGGKIHPSLAIRKAKARMYKSDTLHPENIDYLYSEITSAP